MPELGILSIAILVLLVGLFSKSSSSLSLKIGIFLIIILSCYYYYYFDKINGDLFSNAYLINHTTYKIKSILIGLLSLYLFSYLGYFHSISKKYNYEYLFILLIAILGGFIIISSSNFIPLYLGIELTSLCSYVLAAFNRDDVRSSEAGLKYFTLGSFSSCLMLFGISFMYGISGSLDFKIVNNALQGSPNIMIICGSVLFLSGILFKLSSVPFHFWTPDVYDGSPILSVTLFSSILKIPALFLAIIMANKVMKPIDYIYVNILQVVTIASLIIGSIGAVMQKSIKRLMAYSTILNIGFALIGVIIGNDAIDKSIIYIIIYSISIIGFFTILYMLIGKEAENATIYDLQGLARLKKFGTAGIAFIMFSMIGLPPFAGFFAKYIILYQALTKKFYLLFVVAIFSALISAYYYLKIVAMLYFNKTKMNDRVMTSKYSLFVSIISFIFISFFSLLPIKDLLNYKIFI
jgi:NADH-quinone oxidoreductase subunit N